MNRIDAPTWKQRIFLPAVALLCLGALLPAAAVAQSSPGVKWEKDILVFEASDKVNPPPAGAILFLGASSTRLWKTLAQDFPGKTVINRGFGGSQMEDAVYFADRIVIPYRPKRIVLQEGGNDIHAGKTPQQVLEGFQAFVKKVRAALPSVTIAFMSINPSPSRWAQAEKQQEANRLIREFVASHPGLDYIDIWDAFLGPDRKPREDLFVADRLHNNAEGYRIRADLTRPHLEDPK